MEHRHTVLLTKSLALFVLGILPALSAYVHWEVDVRIRAHADRFYEEYAARIPEDVDLPLTPGPYPPRTIFDAIADLLFTWNRIIMPITSIITLALGIRTFRKTRQYERSRTRTAAMALQLVGLVALVLFYAAVVSIFLLMLNAWRHFRW